MLRTACCNAVANAGPQRLGGGNAEPAAAWFAAMSSQDEIDRFIGSSFRSIWSLELLLLLKRDRRAWSQEELVETLRASDLVVSQALDSLIAAGLASPDEEGKATYMPVSPEVERLVQETDDLYARKPDAVRRLIVASSSTGLTAFADAFRLWKGEQ